MVEGRLFDRAAVGVELLRAAGRSARPCRSPASRARVGELGKARARACRAPRLRRSGGCRGSSSARGAARGSGRDRRSARSHSTWNVVVERVHGQVVRPQPRKHAERRLERARPVDPGGVGVAGDPAPDQATRCASRSSASARQEPRLAEVDQELLAAQLPDVLDVAVADVAAVHRHVGVIDGRPRVPVTGSACQAISSP